MPDNPTPAVRYAVLDTNDDLWLGNESGPRTFDDRLLAQCAAQIWSDQVLGTDLSTRFQVREIPEGSFVIRDELEVKRSTLKSLRRIEGDSDAR